MLFFLSRNTGFVLHVDPSAEPTLLFRTGMPKSKYFNIIFQYLFQYFLNPLPVHFKKLQFNITQLPSCYQMVRQNGYLLLY